MAAWAGGTVSVGPSSTWVRDPVVSPRTYGGIRAGPRLRLVHGHDWQARLDVHIDVGLHGPVGLGRRRFRAATVDPRTGEETVRTLIAPRMALGGHVAVGALRAVGPLHLGPQLRGEVDYGTGVALGPWAFSAVDLRIAARVPLGARASLVAAAPLITAVTRLPWSGNPIQPDRGLVGSFYAAGTRLAPPWTHAAVAVDVTVPVGAITVVGGLSGRIDTVPAPLVWGKAHLGMGWSW